MAATPDSMVPAVVESMAVLSDEELLGALEEVLNNRMEVLQALVNWAVPDLVYVPTRALTGRRFSGIIKSYKSREGTGLITCPAVSDVFGHDVVLHGVQMNGLHVGQQVNFAVLLNGDQTPQAFDVVEGAAELYGLLKDSQVETWSAAWNGNDAQVAPRWPAQREPQAAPAMADGTGAGYSGYDGRRFEGVIKTYNAQKGFGFIKSDEFIQVWGQEVDIFVHKNNIAAEFNLNDTVSFRVHLNSQGRPQAQEVGPPDPQKRMRLA
mmetsp:Transcript_25159/g.55147  ORF Transcript_25159/g.55147 Transcript_25159/m.55147 type:complete len:265 (+) Transcript_25159:64-858(+)